MSVHENVFRSWLRAKWRAAGHWSSAVEYAVGGDDGFPDLVLLDTHKRMVPVELKCAAIVNGMLIPREVRAAQVMWHREFNRCGGFSRFLVGVLVPKRKEWIVYGVSTSVMLDKWRDGFVLGSADLVPITTTDDSQFASRLMAFISRVSSLND